MSKIMKQNNKRFQKKNMKKVEPKIISLYPEISGQTKKIRKEKINKKVTRNKYWNNLLKNINRKNKTKGQNKIWHLGFSGWFIFCKLHYDREVAKIIAELEEGEELEKEDYIRIWKEVLEEKLPPESFVVLDSRQNYTLRNIFFTTKPEVEHKNQKNKTKKSNLIVETQKWEYKWKKTKTDGLLSKNIELQKCLKQYVEQKGAKVKAKKINDSNFIFRSLEGSYTQLNYSLFKTIYAQKLQKKIFYLYLLKNMSRQFKNTVLFFWKLKMLNHVSLKKGTLNLLLQSFSGEVSTFGFSLIPFVKNHTVNKTQIIIEKRKVYLKNILNNSFFFLSFFSKLIIVNNIEVKGLSEKIRNDNFDLELYYIFKTLEWKKATNFRNFYKTNFILFFLVKMELQNKKVKNIWRKDFNFALFVKQITFFFLKNVNVKQKSLIFLENFLNSFPFLLKNLLKSQGEKKKLIQNYLWKRGIINLRKYIQKQKIRKKKKRLLKIQKNKWKTSLNYCYLIKRLENKHARLKIRKLELETLEDKGKIEQKLSKISEVLLYYRAAKGSKLRQHFRTDIGKRKKKVVQRWVKKRMDNLFPVFMKKYIKKNKNNFTLKEKTLVLKLFLKFKKKTLTDRLIEYKKNKKLVYFKKKKLFARAFRYGKLWNIKAYKSILSEKTNLLSKVKNRKTIKEMRFHDTFKQNIKSFKNFKKTKQKTKKIKKIVQKNAYISFKRQKELLFLLLNRKVSIFYINALSLTRFTYISSKKSRKYLQKIEREMINRFKYIAIYIQDLVRIGFITMFLKKATFLVNFIAFQLEKLPKNRKETKFIRFVIKLVKISAAQRKEMIGLRIKFKGRVNRWRRTKSIVGSRKVILNSSTDTRIEYGSAKAINRKGALGISLWISYKPLFNETLLDVVCKYQKYSKLLRWKSLTRYYNKFL